MKNNETKGDIKWLRWPWNLVIYVVLVLVLRIFAVPIILALMAWKKKREPDGPAEGYCLQRCHNRLALLGWAVLLWFISAACIVVFITQIQEERDYWEATDYAMTGCAAVFGVACFLGGLYEGYISLRDALCPDKSRLAKSIRSQMPYPDGNYDVKELFAMVDKDIRENGLWFDRVAVGQEWVLGDDASYIPRIRAVFGRDEVVYRHVNGGTQARRIIELYILDDHKHLQMTVLRKPRELSVLLDCLKLRAPDALFLPYDEYHNYNSKSDDEWEHICREYRIRKSQREQGY